LILNIKGRREARSGFCIFSGYKWCGPGCSGPGKPINAVDACCKVHDECLRFRSQCECDRKFLRCLRPKVGLTSEKGRTAALMYTYMKIETTFTCTKRNE
jgi:hypothetical protein